MDAPPRTKLSTVFISENTRPVRHIAPSSADRAYVGISPRALLPEEESWLRTDGSRTRSISIPALGRPGTDCRPDGLGRWKDAKAQAMMRISCRNTSRCFQERSQNFPNVTGLSQISRPCQQRPTRMPGTVIQGPRRVHLAGDRRPPFRSAFGVFYS